MTQPLYPCLWFRGNAREAAAFYCKVFNRSAITSENPQVVMFSLHGEPFMALNGGSLFTFNPSASIFVACDTVDEINAVWEQLADGGTPLMPINQYPWSERFGWITDRYGLSWQLMVTKREPGEQKFSPLLMFVGPQNGHAEKAIRFYTTVFNNSSVKNIARYETGEGDVAGHIKHARFCINTYEMRVMESSGPHAFAFNESFSMVVTCETQDEIDDYWSRLTADGGQESQCGWLKDQFGVSWQIVPSILGSLMNDPEKAPKVMQAFLKMKKFDIAALQAAATN
ncbi:MAG TPA: VOC family protein [Chitinophagaceae bacterium]|jgi:predicted 3-demethylubiquinone-9 3-methyltransferase (glyoxalase superfamily)|nr:VOC family protein [Chitinophagaceae bacterium]